MDYYSMLMKCKKCGYTMLNGLGTGRARVLDKIKCPKCGGVGFE